MESFENKLAATEKTLENIRGIFDKNNVKSKLEDLEKTSQKENFWKDKDLVKKTIRQKKIYLEILNSYQNSLKDLANLKDLFLLANQEKNLEIIDDCILKIGEIYTNIKKMKLIASFQEKMTI